MSLGELFTGLGYAVGAIVFLWAAKKKGVATEGMGLVAACGFILGILGAKLTQLVAQGWPFRVPAIAIVDPESGGRALLGGVIFGWIGVELAKRRLGIKRSTGDLFALALPAGEAVGRIGCYFNACCYGIPCDLPWAVYQHGAQRHPTQIYSSLTALALLGYLLWVSRKGDRPEGDLFYRYLIGFGATRFLIEFVRFRESVILGLSPMQWFCLDLIVGGAIGLRVLSKRRPAMAEAV